MTGVDRQAPRIAVTRPRRALTAHQVKPQSDRRPLWAVTLLLLSILGCGPEHTGPSVGITLYEHPNFEGDSRSFDGDFNDFRDLRGPCSRAFEEEDGDWNDCASSILVPPGWEATIFVDQNYFGESLIVTEDIRDLDDVPGPCGNDWDDCISSIRVSRP